MRPNHLRNVTGSSIAHRGLFSPDCPENSLEALLKACNKDHWIEFDLRLSQDGQAIVFHDENLLRMCGVAGEVQDLKSQDLTQMSLKSTACKIPLFKTLLQCVPEQATLVVELKTFTDRLGFFENDALEKEVLSCLVNFKGRALIKSFNPKTVLNLKKLNADHSVGFLSCNHLLDKDFTFTTKQAALDLQNLETEAAVRADFISYSVQDLTEELSEKVRKVRQQGLMVWTVRSEALRDKALALADNYIFEVF
jgi:glycerophosphoryl diester phosphodiesterase